MKKWNFESKPALSMTLRMISGPEDNSSTFLALTMGKIKQLFRCTFKIQKIVVEWTKLWAVKTGIKYILLAKYSVQTNLE
jgi:hypothetical protein